jgi:hypothetical protein
MIKSTEIEVKFLFGQKIKNSLIVSFKENSSMKKKARFVLKLTKILNKFKKFDRKFLSFKRKIILKT